MDSYIRQRVETFESMHLQLHRERRAMERLWERTRETNPTYSDQYHGNVWRYSRHHWQFSSGD